MKSSTPTTGNPEPRTHNRAGIRVLLDPGHGLPDPGAVGPTGLTEQEVVLDVALRLEALLKEQGIAASLTRRDKSIAGGLPAKSLSSRILINRSLAHRVTLAAEVRATHFLSIHCNAAVDRSAHGFEVFHNAQGTAFGNALFSTMKERLASHRPRRVLLDRTLYVLRKQVIPAALVELEFISHMEQEAIFRKSESRDFYAKSLAEGVIRMFGLGKEVKAS